MYVQCFSYFIANDVECVMLDCSRNSMNWLFLLHTRVCLQMRAMSAWRTMWIFTVSCQKQCLLTLSTLKLSPIR